MRRHALYAVLSRLLATAAIIMLLVPGAVHAAQQFAGLCAIVQMEILQEFTLERTGFLATLEITNNEGDANKVAAVLALDDVDRATADRIAQKINGTRYRERTLTAYAPLFT